MQTLIITAHPSSQGFTHQVSSTYKTEKEKNGQTVEVLDLYKDCSQGFLFFEEKSELVTDPNKLNEFQTKIADADELVFVFPLRWGGMPAIMKNFIDNNFTSGFAYKYTKSGRETLLDGKTAKMFITCDAPWIFFALFPISLRFFFKFVVLGFCGIKMTDFMLIDQVRVKRKKPGSLDKILEKIKKSAGK